MRTLITLVAALALATAAEAQGPPIEIVGHRVELVAQDVMAGRMFDQSRLRLEVANRTDQAVAAWRAVAVFTDPFGDELFRIQLTSGQADIAPGETKEATFAFDDNPFIPEEPADHLRQYGDRIGVRLEGIRVVH